MTAVIQPMALRQIAAVWQGFDRDLTASRANNSLLTQLPRHADSAFDRCSSKLRKNGATMQNLRSEPSVKIKKRAADPSRDVVSSEAAHLLRMTEMAANFGEKSACRRRIRVEKLVQQRAGEPEQLCALHRDSRAGMSRLSTVKNRAD